MGPVTPLLAVLRHMRKCDPTLEFAWAGTPDGPERAVLEHEDVAFYPVTVAKLPRYPSLTWLTWPFKYWRARQEAERIVYEIQPSLVASAGGFTSVPVMRAAFSRAIPCVIHQLDAEPGLSNRAVAKICSLVTTTFTYVVPPFPGVESERVSTPCRLSGLPVPTREEAARSFGLDPARQIVFFVGGGTGASALNAAVWNILQTLLRDTQVIHLTGRGKSIGVPATPSYVVNEFFDEQGMLRAYAAADLVISRAGIGSISELACLSKAAIFVPIPQSHQELNVKKLPCAAVQQGSDFSTRLLKHIRTFLKDDDRRLELGHRLHEAMPTDDGSILAEKWLACLKRTV